MSTAKDEILGRIRTALADRPQPDTVERDYRRVSEASREQVVEQLVDRLEDYRADVYRETAETVAARPGPVPAASAAESERVLRWLEQPGVRLVEVEGEWTCPVRGAAPHLTRLAPGPRDPATVGLPSPAGVS